MDKDPDLEKIDDYVLMRHQYLRDREEARRNKKKQEEEDLKHKQLMKAKESSKMPVHRHQYIGFIRAVTAN